MTPTLEVVEVDGRLVGWCPAHDRLLEEWQMACPSCTYADVTLPAYYFGLQGLHSTEDLAHA